MQFANLTATDEENVEFGLRLVVSLRWEHMIKASQDRLSHSNRVYANRKYAEAVTSYESITGIPAGSGEFIAQKMHDLINAL